MGFLKRQAREVMAPQGRISHQSYGSDDCVVVIEGNSEPPGTNSSYIALVMDDYEDGFFRAMPEPDRLDFKPGERGHVRVKSCAPNGDFDLSELRVRVTRNPQDVMELSDDAFRPVRAVLSGLKPVGNSTFKIKQMRDGKKVRWED